MKEVGSGSELGSESVEKELENLISKFAYLVVLPTLLDFYTFALLFTPNSHNKAIGNSIPKSGLL